MPTVHASIVLVVALLMVKMSAEELESQAALSTTSRLLTPPPGNSLAISAITLDGKLKYVCEKGGGQWLPVQKRATLMDETNHTKVIGFYRRNYHLSFSSRHMGTWTIINSEGDEAESGHPTSLVSGNKLVAIGRGKDKLPEFLAQASLHRYEGAARMVSYIAELNTKLLTRLPRASCGAEKMTMSIEYTATYAFWRQDVLPPKVPSSLAVPAAQHQQQVVEAFFAQGNVRFKYDHKTRSWRQRRVVAKLYDVPGGLQVGGFSYNLSFNVYSDLAFACLDIYNPNGFNVCGLLQQSMAFSPAPHHTSLPWSLFRVTSNRGYITKILGPFTFFHMVSTWGGLPPQASNDSTVPITSNGWKSYFTSIFWLYRSKGA